MLNSRFLVAATATLALGAPAVAMPTFNFADATAPDDGRVVNYVGPDGALSPLGAEMDAATGGRLSTAIREMEMKGEFGETLSLAGLAPYAQIVVIGKGDEALKARQLHDLGGHAAMATDDEKGLSILADGFDGVEDAAAQIAFGYALGDYSFTTYKTDPDMEEDGEVTLLASQPNAASLFENDLKHLASSIELVRDLGSEPGNALWPQAFVDRVQTAFEGTANVNVTVLDADAIRERGMGALMGVGQGSIQDPRLMVVEYSGGADGEAPIALVGKGITFDTGGISIKPSENMWYMKADMSGAAAVAGTVLAAAKRGAPINIVGVMPLAENMPSQDAIRPGDVLTSMSGKTVEVLNTDAEGRLLLLDAVHYAQEEYAPRMLVNIATLTGSAVRATSAEYAAVITRDIALSLEMMEIGKDAGEDVWPLPLHANHFKQIESKIADIKNVAGIPGASIGAAVVGTFIDEDLEWVHLDIAGVDWRDEATPTAPVGHAGWGVRFLDELVRRETS